MPSIFEQIDMLRPSSQSWLAEINALYAEIARTASGALAESREHKRSFLRATADRLDALKATIETNAVVYRDLDQLARQLNMEARAC